MRFETDGVCAVTDAALTDNTVACVAHAFARYCGQAGIGLQAPIAVAFGGRRNSQRYASLVADVLSSYGWMVLLSDRIVPAPVLSFTVKQRGCAAGMMIDAGSYPPEYNGIRFKASYGGPFTPEETKKVEAGLLSDPEQYTARPANIRLCNFLPDYTAQLKRLVDFDSLRAFASASGDHAAVMIDSMGGAGQTLIEDLLSDCGWRAHTLFGAPDERFYGRSPEPNARNLGPLIYNVSVTDALCGIATDGDAGRCGIVYDDGRWMNAQESFLAIMSHLHERKRWTGSIVTSASVTEEMRRLAESWGIKLHETAGGFHNILKAMMAEDCMCGMEEEGGFAFKRHIPDRDGILTGLLFAEMIALSGKSLRSSIADVRGPVAES